MSADNWAICPRCVYRHEQKALDLRTAADAAYGKVSVEEWKQLDADALKAARPIDKPTFREDYKIGIDGNRLCITYEGGCSVCGFSASFKHDALVEGVEA